MLFRSDKPKLKIQGIEAVRSSTPKACRESIKKALEVIMNENEESFQKYIKKFRKEFMSLQFEDIAFPRSVKLTYWRNNSNGGSFKSNYNLNDKGLPIQVRGSLRYNDMLMRLGLDKKYAPITEGDKIKFTYLIMPNPLHDTVIASNDALPKEFGLDTYIDYDTQFKKSFLEPLTSITEVIGWQVEKTASLNNFFYYE